LSKYLSPFTIHFQTMTTTQAILLAIIEGLTEFLPISSTGHMIIGTSLLGLQPDEFVKMFTVNIQFGAILSVVVLYWKRFFQSLDFYYKLIIAFIPAAIFGVLLHKQIDELLGSVETVAVALLLGGIVLMFVDKYFAANEKQPEKNISYLSSLIIGFFQVISMIPGVSRSGATIVGGLSQKLSRKQAAEFSFFLAVPTMAAATCFELLKNYKMIDSSNIKLLLIGNVVAFIVALIAIKAFIGILNKYGFKYFGIYRIIIGGTIIILLAMKINLAVL